MKRITVVLLVAFLLTSTIFASGATETSTAKDESTGKRMTVGVSYCLLSAPAVKVFAQGIREKADELGIDLLEVDASWDAQKQTDQMNSFIAQKVDAIVLNPVDSSSIVPVVKKAFEAGIPVVMGAMNIDISGQDFVVSYVGADEEDVGRAAGLLLKNHLGAGKFSVAIVEGLAGSDPQIKRTSGFEDAIKGSTIEVVAKVPGDFDKAKAMTVTEDLLMRFPNLDGIWVHDDTMCVGVVQAIKSMGYSGKDIAVVSYNGSKRGADMVKAGDIIGTAVQPLVVEGSTSIQVAIDAANGKPVEKWYKDVIKPITADNVNEYNSDLLW
jgi:ABC-type sugar transport system substrate-binding protein